ncbi:MAG: adenylate/guanylate cyclase domain-containing protein [Syntrophotaleaceae bacterium]
MPNNEWVDTREAAELRRKESRRQLMQSLLPAIYLVILVAVVMAIARYTYTRNRRDAVALADSLVEMLDQRITSQVKNHLSPAGELTRLASGLFASKNWSTEAVNLFETLGLQFLAVYPQIQSFQVGIPDGRFLMVRRMSDGSMHTKIIRQTGPNREVRWVRRDPAGNILGIEQDQADTYDPRTRPWYQGAAQSQEVYWTDVYIFFSNREPGVTAALAVRDPQGDLRGVLSIDIELAGLSRFLAGLEIGKTGRALIIDGKGQLVAFPVMDRMLRISKGSFAPVKIDQLDNALLTRAYDRFRIEGYGIRHLALDGKRYSSMTSSLRSLVNREWTLLITVPEADFVGFLKENLQRALLLSSIAFFMVALIAALLLMRSQKAIRTQRQLAARERRMEAQSQAFENIVSLPSLYRQGDNESLQSLSEIVCQTMAIRRFSLWKTMDHGKDLVCLDSYDRENNGHTSGTILSQQDFPRFFEAVSGSDPIESTDLENDLRAGEIFKAYFEPLDCCALLATPIRPGNRSAGSVWLEHDGKSRGWSKEDRNLARAIAGLLAFRFQDDGEHTLSSFETVHEDILVESPGAEDGQKSQAPWVSVETSPTLPPLRTMRGASLRDSLQGPDRPQPDPKTVYSTVFENLSVMVVLLGDSLFLAHPEENTACSLLEDLVCRIEQIATANGIEYLKMLGDQIVLATGFSNTSGQHAQRTADSALAILEELPRVFPVNSESGVLRVGFDTGMVLGNLVGCGKGSFNLWGPAVRSASGMASSSPENGIQAGEGAYRHLQNDYLFGQRGTFFVPDIGEIRTYLLRGKIG